MEELFLKALLWIDNIAPQDDYLDLLHEIYLQPENKDNGLINHQDTLVLL